MSFPGTDRGRALVIDDDPAVRELVGEFLRRVGFDARTAASGPEGLRGLDGDRDVLVVTDLSMPEMTGWEVVEAVRRRAPGAAIILATGSTTNLDTDRARDARVVLLSKPFLAEELEAAAEAALRMAAADAPAPWLAAARPSAPAAVGFAGPPRALDEAVRQATVGLRAISGMMEDVQRAREAWREQWAALQEDYRALREAHERLAQAHRTDAEALARLREEHRRLEREHAASLGLLSEAREAVGSCLDRLGRGAGRGAPDPVSDPPASTGR